MGRWLVAVHNTPICLHGNSLTAVLFWRFGDCMTVVVHIVRLPPHALCGGRTTRVRRPSYNGCFSKNAV